MLGVEQSSEKHTLKFVVWFPKNVEGHVYCKNSASVGNQVVTFLGDSYIDTQVTTIYFWSTEQFIELANWFLIYADLIDGKAETLSWINRFHCKSSREKIVINIL